MTSGETNSILFDFTIGVCGERYYTGVSTSFEAERLKLRFVIYFFGGVSNMGLIVTVVAAELDAMSSSFYHS